MPENNRDNGNGNGGSGSGGASTDSIIKTPQVLLAAAAGGLIGGLVGALIGSGLV